MTADVGGSGRVTRDTCDPSAATKAVAPVRCHQCYRHLAPPVAAATTTVAVDGTGTMITSTVPAKVPLTSATTQCAATRVRPLKQPHQCPATSAAATTTASAAANHINTCHSTTIAATAPRCHDGHDECGDECQD